MNIYLDHGATTPCDKAVVDKMLPFMTDVFGNADSLHSFGRQSAKAVSQARQDIAAVLNCQPNEVYFTASGTEADNWALKGAALMRKKQGKGNRVIISAIEHHAILTAAEWLKKQGFEVIKLPVNDKGIVEIASLEQVITDDTAVVSVMYANNEVGTIQPIRELCKIAHKHGALFHTDCVQAVPYLKLDVKDLGVDMLSISAHKFYGPKGVGALYIKNGVRIEKLLHGGEQERAQRGGTTNTAGVVGMAEALKLCVANMDKNNKHIAKLRDHFESRVLKEIEFVRQNGDRQNRIPSVANFSFEFVEGEGILMLLDFSGIAVSSGSACASGSLDPSHVLLSMGVPIEIAHGSIRFSFGKNNTMEQADYAADKLVEIIARLRQMSPLFNLKKGEVHNV